MFDIVQDTPDRNHPPAAPRAGFLDGFNERIIALLISKVTDAVFEELEEWRNRPLDSVYPIVYIDALNVKIPRRDRIHNRLASLNGARLKQVLGLWIGKSEGESSKFCWLSSPRLEPAAFPMC